MAVPPPAPPDKAGLRAQLKALRVDLAKLPDGDQAHAMAAIAARTLAHIGQALCVAGYSALAGEVDPAPILAAVAERGDAVALPRVVTGSPDMRFHLWPSGEPLEPGPLGLRQPRATAPLAEPDLILVPLLGFDRRLARLGFGAGYYDRALAALPGARRIGLAWAAQEVAAIPTDPWDVPLDAVATEREWIAL